MSVCIGCGCEDFRACWDEVAGQPCHWLRNDTVIERGVCSVCPEHVKRFDNGDFEIAVPFGNDDVGKLTAVELLKRHLSNGYGSLTYNAFSEFSVRAVSAVESALGEDATIADVRNVLSNRESLENLYKSHPTSELNELLSYEADYLFRALAYPQAVLSRGVYHS